MTRLRLTGISEDGLRLSLTGPDGAAYLLAVDDALREAVRPRRQWQLEMAMDGELTPREIQTRVRAGESPEQIAADAGVPLDRVERFARPVLGERARIVELARTAALDPGSLAASATLADRVDEALQAAGAEEVVWDSHRESDGRWAVHVSYSAEGRLRTASWWYDAATRSVSPADGRATALQEPGGDVLPLPRRRSAGPPPTPEPIPALIEEPEAATEPESAPVAPAEPAERAEPVTPRGPVLVEAAPEPEEPAALPLQVADAPESTPEEPPSAPKAKRRKRASVPSWDDIVFGTRHDD